jgi:DNA-binding NarL/FixJ family response regulator
MAAMIHIALLDDHPAVLGGLQRLVEAEPDLSLLAAVEDEEGLWQHLRVARADVVVCDYDLARGNGLAVCQRLKENSDPPAIVIYSAYAGATLALAARIAGADAVVDKGAPVADLLAAIRAVAAGRTVIPDIPPELRQTAIARVEPDDVAIAAMLVAGTSHEDIAAALGKERHDVTIRARRVLSRVRPNGSRHARPAVAERRARQFT